MLATLSSRRRSRSTPPWVLAVLAATVCVPGLGGCSDDFFVCSSDGQCTEAEGGRCEASGACSFPEPTCPTGRRYGEAGNPQVAGACVPPEDIGSTGASGAGNSADATSSESSESESSTSLGETGTSAGQTSSTGGSSTQSGATESSTGSDASSSSTGDEPPPPDLYAACEDPEDCSNMTCSFVMTQDMDVVAGFCTAAGCTDPSIDCTDPGTGATPICTTLALNGAPGLACALDCGRTGTSGCPDGMTCYDNIVGQPALCFHPV